MILSVLKTDSYYEVQSGEIVTVVCQALGRLLRYVLGYYRGVLPMVIRYTI